MPQFYTLLTDVGQAKLANAVALGTSIEITQLAVGDGGGDLPTPDSSATALVSEVRRAAINASQTDPDNPSWIVVEQVLPPDVGGWTIREIGIYDFDGDLIGIGNYPETYKPVLSEGSSRTQTVRFVLEVSDTAAVTLKVDPSVVLATRQYVDDGDAAAAQALQDHASSRNHPAATTTARGFVEKATTSEAKSGAADKFPDAAGVLAAMEHFGLGGGVNRSDRLNDLKDSGFYYSTAAVGSSDRPTDADINGYLLVIRHGTNGTYVVQYFVPHDADRLFLRRRNGVSEWSEWVEIYHTGNAIAAQSTVDAGTDDTKFVTAKKLKGWAVQWVKQATETVAGMLKVATQDQVETGDDDTTAVTPKKLSLGFSCSLGVNGYISLPAWLKGLTLQWGKFSGAQNQSWHSVDFPISFPSNAWNISVTLGRASVVSGTISPVVRNLTNEGVEVAGDQDDATSTGDFYWFAIGN